MTEASDPKMDMLEFTASVEDAGKRLDLFLSTSQNILSRSNIRKQLDLGKVTLNGQIEYRPNYKLKLGDKVVMNYTVLKEPELKLKAENIPIDIIYEDNDLLVVNKPAGMVIHPATGNYCGTLMNAVLYHYEKMANVGNAIRSGLIHRIDKDTSGLVMIGKTNKGLWHYSKMFADRKVHKTYLAIVAGNISPKMKEGALNVRNYLGRNVTNRKKYCIVPAAKGRLAETDFRLLKVVNLSGKIYSVVTASPKTGRTHQIRVHLSSIGNPIIGDVIYGKNNKYQRLMLHAWKINVDLLSGETHEFVASIPHEFNRFIDESIQ